VQVGKPQHVEVRADRNLLNRVVTRVRSGVLTISDRGSFTTNSPMSVLVTVPALQSATLSGDGQCTVTDVATKAFKAQLSGSGELTVSGNVERVDASLTGEGRLVLASLLARGVTVALGGTGTAVVSATSSLDAVLSGTGSITYSGQPTHVTKTVTGTRSITAL
jgi:Putative auto-transporter adhesin, head GIN domain